jgi:copper chaperone CopZ|tara:strand:- start:212 stop:715 length:504 start_codon:yes stop_codon:yes gene_type:complete
MSIIKWHKKQIEKNLNYFGFSEYQGFWFSFVKGLLFGILIMWFIGCENKVVVKTPPIENINNEISKISDYKTGVKGNCGMCKTTIEKAVLKVDGVEEADWGINSKILNIKFKENLDNRDDIVKKIESAINMSGYETMNTTANQESYDALPMCCKYDRNMKVPDSKYQ